VLLYKLAAKTLPRARPRDMPKPMTKKAITTTANGGVADIIIIPSTTNASASMNVLARPKRIRSASIMNAAEINPTALAMKMVDTTAYPIL
jgi:hypothetical protein